MSILCKTNCMKSDIHYNISVLKEKIEFNSEVIRKNRELLRDVLNMPLSEMRTELFLEKFEKNLELYSKNNIFLKLQFELHHTLVQKDGLKTFGKMSLS